VDIPTGFIDKARFVRVIFTDVEEEYDTLLRLMTLYFDHVWRRRMYAKIDFQSQMMMLDLACGTGLVTFELSRLAQPASTVIGLDMSPAMLSVANGKKRELRGGCDTAFVRAVGEFLPFRDQSFRYVTVGLALRNFGDKMSMFQETLRALKPSGQFLSVDFVKPDNGLVWRLYCFHLFHVLPALGGLVSGYWKRTLTYLAYAILRSSSPDEICESLYGVGFQTTFLERMTAGIVSLIGGRKTAAASSESSDQQSNRE
jgi:demethylmenaquinone methyltransferase/2-methoxy-6-polyprenyl-1,4-benzoquinol methylase